MGVIAKLPVPIGPTDEVELVEVPQGADEEVVVPPLTRLVGSEVAPVPVCCAVEDSLQE